MKLTGLTLERKLAMERKDFSKRIDKIRNLFLKVDFVTNIKWLNNQEKIEIWVSSNSLIEFQITLSISNVKIDEFIENILGPYHREYGINWEMEVNENEVIEFRKRGSSRYWGTHLVFRVKEGMFKSCTYETKIVKFSKPVEAEPIYATRLICK